MNRRATLPLAASLLALLLALPAGAEVYKWVDERGVVNYGSSPPPGRTVKELPKDAAGVSVVPAPPPAPAPAPAAARSPADERVERLERALAEERAARAGEEQRAEEERRQAIAQCEAARGVDCEQNPYQSLGYGYAPVIVRPHPHVKPLPVVKPPPSRPAPPEEPKRGAVGRPDVWPR